jgi:basic amino acid/polyamine antiporter, APA family
LSSATVPVAGKLSLLGAVSIAVGMVIGAGIFKSPSVVAANVSSVEMLFLVWALGGLVSLIGALCYAELSTAFPSAGGDYHFLRLAYGARVAFLFAWSRFAVINTGSIAGLGFVFGDYTHAVFGPWIETVVPLGTAAPTVYAVLSIIILTLINLKGLRSGVDAQLSLTIGLMLGLAAVGVAGAALAVSGSPPANPQPVAGFSWGAFGLAFVFVFFAFSGWNEIATLSADVKDGKRGMVKALVLSLVIITLLYLVVNWAFWRGLGLGGMAQSPAIAADLMKRAFGAEAQLLIYAIVAAAVITSINATIIVGARTTFAAAKDWPALERLVDWDADKGVPAAAVLAQSAVALMLVGLGAYTKAGFQTLVDYTTPVFHLFLLASGVGLIVLRVRYPNVARPFRTPLYPLTPLLFCLAIGFVLSASLNYVLDPARGDLRLGAAAGLGVLAVGAALTFFMGRPRKPEAVERAQESDKLEAV